MSRLSAARAPLAAAALAPLPFLACLGWGFLAWDDPQVILANPLVRGPQAGSPAAAFASFHMSAWQPLTWLFFAGLDAAGGGSPLPWRLASLLIHALNAGLLAAWLARLLAAAAPGAKDGARAWAAAAAALAWAWHPVQAESVAWASQAGDMLGASFVLAALLARERGRAGEGLFLFALAALFRWKAVAYPALVLARDLVLPAPKGAATRAERAGLIGITLALLAVNGAAKAAWGYAPRLFPHEALTGLLWQALKIAAPVGLAPDAHFDGNDNPLGLGLASTLALWAALAAGAAWAWRRGARAPVAAGAAFLAALLPTVAASSAAPAPLYDHHLYLPLAAAAALVAAVLARARGRAPVLAGLALLALGAGAAAQTRHWRDHETLWGRVLAVRPTARRAGRNLAAARADHGRWGEALLAVDEHLARLPGDEAARALRDDILASAGPAPLGPARVESDAAAALAERGDLAGARARQARALALAPRDPDLLVNGAILDAGAGDLASARARLDAALRAAPRHARAREALALLEAARKARP